MCALPWHTGDRWDTGTMDIQNLGEKKTLFPLGKNTMAQRKSVRTQAQGSEAVAWQAAVAVLALVRVKIKPAGISPQLLGTWRPKIWRTRMRSPKGNCLVSFHSWISILLPVYPQNWPTLNSLILLKVNTLLFSYTFNMEMCTNQLQMQGM